MARECARRRRRVREEKHVDKEQEEIYSRGGRRGNGCVVEGNDLVRDGSSCVGAELQGNHVRRQLDGRRRTDPDLAASS